MLRFQKKGTATDADLLHHYQQTREMEAVTELFGRYTSLVYGVCIKYVKDREDARDLAMQVFEKLIQVLPGQAIDNFKGWLYVTTRNHCLMHLRARRGAKGQEVDVTRMENTLLLHLEDEPEMEENLTKLENCMERLAADQQRCVRMFFLEENSYAQVAEKTGYSLNQVKSYIQNGKRNLKICMEENAG